MVNSPRTFRHHGHFMAKEPSGKINPGPPRAKITAPLFPGIVNKVPSSFPRLNSEPVAPGAAGDLPLGRVTGQEEMADFISGVGVEYGVFDVIGTAGEVVDGEIPAQP